MEHITVGQISIALAFIVATLTTIGTLKVYMKKWLNSMLKDEFAEVKKHVKDLETRLNQTEVESCKNYLVKVISDVERGQGLSETGVQRFYEVYRCYSNEHNKNGYIKAKVEQLEAEKKLVAS